MATQRKAGRFDRKRSAFRSSAAALALLAALTGASCSGTRLPLFIERYQHAPPGIVPALSLAGRAASGCMNARPSYRYRSGFEVVDQSYFDSLGNLAVDAYAIEGVGHPLVHYSRCQRFAVEITVLVSNGGSGRLSYHEELWRTASLLDSLVPRPSERVTLWSIAAYLRISPREPFVYGRKVEIGERDSVSLRLDPTQNDARLMLVYKFEL